MNQADGRELAVVTVNWNGWRNTLDCLAALRGSQDADWRLIIVDNASTDGSVEKLSDLGDDVTLICSSHNGGWTGGNNLGVAHALREGFEHILLLNNDAFVEPETLVAFMEAQRRAPRAILGGVLRDGAGAETQSGFLINPKTGLPRWSPSEALPEAGPNLRKTTAVCGAALFAHRSLFEEIGPFDDAYFLYADEMDWCLRARRAGRECLLVSNAIVEHAGYSSTGGGESPLVAYFHARNGLLFTERHGTILQRARTAKRFLVEAMGPDLVSLARRRAIADYLFRRFGDCPDAIRQAQSAWSAAN